MPGEIATQFVEQIRAISGPIVVDYDTHRPTESEINNLCYLSMKFLVQFSMRTCDLKVVELMAGGLIESIAELNDRYIPALADYIWDHLMGKPEDPTADDLKYCIEAIRDFLYSTDEQIRNSLEETNG